MQSPGQLRDADDNWDINSTTSEDIGYYGGYVKIRYLLYYHQQQDKWVCLGKICIIIAKALGLIL